MPRKGLEHVSLLKQAIASLAAILVLVLTVLAASPELHERIHGHGPSDAPRHSGPGAGQGQGDEDGCIVTLFAQGIVLALALLALVFADGVLRLFYSPGIDRPAAVAPRFLLLPSQAPPLGLG
jgi:hypothetical protein